MSIEMIVMVMLGGQGTVLGPLLGGAGYSPRHINTNARVTMDAGPAITTIELETEAQVANIDEATFMEYVNNAKKNCPVSKALTGVELKVKVTLVG